MKIVRSLRALKRLILSLKKNSKTIGFVPTMGYLHEGHLSLVRLAKKQNDAAIVSIFVNPLQFGPKEDLARYPRDLARDSRLLKSEKTDYLFLPSKDLIYPRGFQTLVQVERLSRPLCGASRPTHFAGVATVVLKLLNLVTPDVLYLGQKDYQQCRLLDQMVKDLNLDVRVIMAPIIREKDGLAMSSRNVLLSRAERQQAVYLSKSLRQLKRSVAAGVRDTAVLRRALRASLGRIPNTRTDYAEIVCADTLQNVVELNSGDRLLAAVAVCFSRTRLIDNILIRV